MRLKPLRAESDPSQMTVENPEPLFRVAGWTFFGLLVIGFGLAALSNDRNSVGPFCLAAGAIQIAMSGAVLFNWRGTAERIRGRDYPPGIYFVVNPLPWQRGSQSRHRAAGLAGLIVGCSIVALGFAAVTSGV
jgi:hypothetical protein